MKTSYRYAAIRSSLAIDLGNHQCRVAANLELVTPSVVAILSPAMTISYSASLFVARKPRVKDCSMLDPFRVVTTILTPATLLFEALFMFRIHPSSKSLYAGAPGVNSTMKSVMTCPLIDVLGSYLISYDLNSDDHFAKPSSFMVFNDTPQRMLC